MKFNKDKNKEKILTILGTRPEIIRLSRILPKIDKLFNQIIVHTGQNYDFELDKIFFKELKVRKPDYHLDAKGSFGNQISIISKELEKIIEKEKPSKFLVLGDTNSSLGCIIAKRMGVKVFHMEAGNRSFNKKSPEEINRKIIDHTSDILLPYTFRSCENLVSEGIKRNLIYVTGNPIFEVIKYNLSLINKSKILKNLNIKKNNFFLVTLHREENVDDIKKLTGFVKGFNLVATYYKKPILWPVHPRTKEKLKQLNTDISNLIKLIKPLGFFDFINLERNSHTVFTDSGTVQEECSIFKIPCIILREFTERPETIEAGSSILLNCKNKGLIQSIEFSKENINLSLKIPEYFQENVSDIIAKILLSH